MENLPSKLNPYLPLFFSITLAIGVYMGWNLNPNDANQKNDEFRKLGATIDHIERNYVDSINRKTLVNNAIKDILNRLDPHSVYIPPIDAQAAREELTGNFGGIGIRFIIIDDTLAITHLIKDAPAINAGLQQGDRIITVNDSSIIGIDINNQRVFNKLKGKPGSNVSLKVFRAGKTIEQPFKIKRGMIPINSVETSFMITNEIGYLRLARFADPTYKEFSKATSDLKNEGMKKLIFDLRGNGGGYLKAATKIVDEFLPKDKLIVFTEGSSRSREEYRSTSKGNLKKVELVVLIDHQSASASEIVAGAIQDNDRGTIMGLRSFGKGLVQQETEAWKDGSAIRLTVARYYTPTGRSIQKPYGNNIRYEEEAYSRYEKGEFLKMDSSLLVDSLKFITPGGKAVYGGGGIMPDVFIPFDTSGRSDYLNALYLSRCFYDFGFYYTDKKRKQLTKRYQNLVNFKSEFVVNARLIKEFINFTKKKGIHENKAERSISMEIISNVIKREIARNLWGQEGYYRIATETDKSVQNAKLFLNTNN